MQGSTSLQSVLLLHFDFSVGIFYSYIINFDHTENFMATGLDVISVNFVTPQSKLDMSVTYISYGGNLELCWKENGSNVQSMQYIMNGNVWKSLIHTDWYSPARHHEKDEIMTPATLLFCRLPART